MARPLLPARPPVENAVPDDLLRLARTPFTNALYRLRESPSIGDLRSALDLLWRQIDDPAGALRTAADEDVTIFSKRRLREAFDQIAATFTLERARYYLDRLVRAACESRTGAINDIDLNRWKEYDDILTDSLWLFDRRDASGAHHAGVLG